MERRRMSLAQRILYAIRTLTDDEPHQPQRRRHDTTPEHQRSSIRRMQAVALVLTFRDVFTSGGLNLLLEDNQNLPKPPHKKDVGVIVDMPTNVSVPQEQRTIPLPNVSTTELVVSRGGLLSRNPDTVTVALPADDENRTVAALRKVLKWSPRKQSLAKFSVPLQREDEQYKAVTVVQNAVNRVKEEQEKKKRKRKIFSLTFC